jgi:hypothetical protein
MNHQTDDGKQEKQVNQSAGHVEKNETADPNDGQKYRQGKKRSESHGDPPFKIQSMNECHTELLSHREIFSRDRR